MPITESITGGATEMTTEWNVWCSRCKRYIPLVGGNAAKHQFKGKVCPMSGKFYTEVLDDGESKGKRKS